MNLVIDTNVFLPYCGEDEEARKVFSKIIRDCDTVVIDRRIQDEYSSVLIKNGMSKTIVIARLMDLTARKKLNRVTDEVQTLGDIIVHGRDRHLIECAHVSKGIIITYEQFDKAKIRSELKIDVLLPSEYLRKEKIGQEKKR
jgi:predicted nucleic acid-binding protein